MRVFLVNDLSRAFLQLINLVNFGKIMYISLLAIVFPTRVLSKTELVRDFGIINMLKCANFAMAMLYRDHITCS